MPAPTLTPKITLNNFTTEFYVGDAFSIPNGAYATVWLPRNDGTTQLDGTVALTTTTSDVSSTYENQTLNTVTDSMAIPIIVNCNGTRYTENHIIKVQEKNYSISTATITDWKRDYKKTETFYYSDIKQFSVVYTNGNNEITLTSDNLTYTIRSVKNGLNELVSGETKFLDDSQSLTLTATIQIEYKSENGINYIGRTLDVSFTITFSTSSLVQMNIKPIWLSGKQTAKGVEFGDEVMRYPLVDENANPEITTSNVLSREDEILGYIELGSMELGENAKIVFFDDLTNVKQNDIEVVDNNVVVTFPCLIDGNADKINKCTFGKLYNHQLFLSGNKYYPNVDYHSSPVNPETEQENTNDLTYFSVLDYCNYGNDDTAVVGYDTYRDGDLIVFKQDSSSQATIYRRTTNTTQATDFTGAKIEGSYEEIYPCFEINTNGGEGALSQNSIVNFMGSTLFLSKSGLKVLSSKETTYNNARYSYDVSSNINFVLENSLSKNDKLFVFKEKLFLVANNKVFMAFNDLRVENELEWFPIELGFVPNTMFEIDDEIYFDDEKGNIYRFNNNEYNYNDRSVAKHGKGVFIFNRDYTNSEDGNYNNLDNDDYGFAISKKALNDIEIGTKVQLFTPYSNKYYYKELLSINPRGDSRVVTKTINGTINGYIKIVDGDDCSYYFADERYVWVLLPISNEFKRFKLKFFEEEFENSFSLYALMDESNQPFDIIGALSFIIDDSLLFIGIELNEDYQLEINAIRNDEDDFADIKLVDGFGYSIKISDLTWRSDVGANAQTNQPIVLIYKETPVDAYYKTKTFDFGTNVYEKTIWGLILANNSGLASQTEIGYVSSRKQNDFIFEADASQTNLNDFSFDSIQFDNDALPHIYSKYKVIPRVNFIRFLFQNNSDSNLILSELSLVYTISRLTRGIK